jgi:hypothetical protein
VTPEAVRPEMQSRTRCAIACGVRARRNGMLGFQSNATREPNDVTSTSAQPRHKMSTSPRDWCSYRPLFRDRLSKVGVRMAARAWSDKLSPTRCAIGGGRALFGLGVCSNPRAPSPAGGWAALRATHAWASREPTGRGKCATFSVARSHQPVKPNDAPILAAL